MILEQIAEGDSWDIVRSNYPELKKEDIQAALIYERESIDPTESRFAYT